MINKKHKPGIQTDLEDLIIFAENDQAFANAIEIDKKQALPEPLASYNEKIQKLIVTVMREEKVQHTKKKTVGLKELSIQLKNPAFCKTILKKP